MIRSTSTSTRRRFLGSAAGLGLGGLLGADGARAQSTGGIVLPFGNGERPITEDFPQKGAMILQRTRPPQLETPFEVFDQGVFTPNDRFFVRWHLANIPTEIDPATFRIKVRGHVNKTIEVLSARHSVPAAGFAVEGGAGWWVYSGDTGPNPTLWQRLKDMKVAQLVIETAFGDDERALAGVSRHLCPATLGAELAQLAGPLNASVDVRITHIKPGASSAVMAEIARIQTPHRIGALAAGQTLTLARSNEAAARADVTNCVAGERRPAGFDTHL